jgi:urea transport system permease protein
VGGVLSALVLVMVPILNTLPSGSPLQVPDYLIPTLGKFLCYAVVAMAMGLVWGYVGILSLGHALFFALGGYAMGMYLMRSIGGEGVYRSELPDFMVFLDWKALPWSWYGFDSFHFAVLMAAVVPGLLAFLFGWVAFRSRIRGVYFSIVTQALTYAAMLLFFRNNTGFGGNNGLTDFKRILGYSLQDSETKIVLYLCSAGLLLGTFFLCRFVIRSKLGRTLTAVRDVELKVRFCGYDPTHFKLFAWTLSAALCGLAGALYVPQVGIINPSEMQPSNSIDIAIWVAVGGRGTLIGPAVGAFVVNGFKSWLTMEFPSAWLYFLAALFVAVTLFFPRGLVGLLDGFKSRMGLSRRRPGSEPASPKSATSDAAANAAPNAVQGDVNENDNSAKQPNAGQVDPSHAARPRHDVSNDHEAHNGHSAPETRPVAKTPGPEGMQPDASSGPVVKTASSGVPHTDKKAKPTILLVDGVTVSFDGFKALDALTLTLEQGELRCIIGPNGAGKTTLMDVITGKTRPDKGSVRMPLTGRELTTMSEHEIARLGIGRKFQRPTVFPGHTVFENLELAVAGPKGVFPSLFGRLSGPQRDKVDEVLETIRLSDMRGDLAGRLSHGHKQWLELGMLLAQGPEVLFVDEPIAGMTHQEVERTAELLQRLAGKHTVVVVEHDMEFVRSIARQVTVLHEGRVLAEGTMDRIQNDPRVIEVYLGSNAEGATNDHAYDAAG